jgi:AraC family transcriptional regulator, regulatory protein of adaptative response / methylated-DNA-[protein]-cysteine methyltransferase
MNAIPNRSHAEAETLRFACRNCWLGEVLVAVSNKGLAAILIGDNSSRLRRDLAAAFPLAGLVHDDDGLHDAIAKVVAFLEAPGEGLNIELDMRGDALQQAVWRALRAVPSGRTVTYGQIARSLAMPTTAQDVGAACAANVLAVAIPCHRVVKADGAISGYRWGVERKKRLINREALA